VTVLRNVTKADWPRLLELNEASVEQLSPMDEVMLARFVDAAFSLRVAEQDGSVAGFLLSFRRGAAYRGQVFQHLSQQEEDFAYIDRVVVDAAARGRGIASRLYDDLVATARAAGLPRLLCEAYKTNEQSLKFHARQRFHVFGDFISHGQPVALLERRL
jgi:predicted GNAT superfamily acetyltransferase